MISSCMKMIEDDRVLYEDDEDDIIFYEDDGDDIIFSYKMYEDDRR